MSNLDEFFGTDPAWNQDPDNANPATLHLAGLDGIDRSFDAVHPDVLAGAIGFDPADVYAPSLDTQLAIEKELPQWGPPFVKFVDDRISDLEKKVIKELEKWQFQSVTIFINSGMNTNSAGTIDPVTNDKATVYSPPPGFTLALHRFGVFLDTAAANFGTPKSNASSYYEIRVNNEAIDGGSLAAAPNGVPFVRSWGTRDAPRIRDGENLSFFLFGIGLANTRFNIKGQGTLDRTIEG